MATVSLRALLSSLYARVLPANTSRTHTFIVCIVQLLVLLAVGSVPGARFRTPIPAEKMPEVVSPLVEVVAHVTANGLPVSGAHVRALPADGHQASAPPRDGYSDQRGTAKLLVPAGATWILTDASGYARASKMRVVSGPTDLAFELVAETILTVELRDEAGHAITGEVEVRGADPAPIGARTNKEGHAEVHGLGAGPWSVTARAPGYDTTTLRHTGDTVLRIQLHRLARLRVAVSDGEGKPVADAEVSVSSAVLWPPRKAKTDETGAVLISGLPLGSYAVRATKGGLVSPTELGLALGRGADVNIGLKMEPGVIVRVRVVEAPADQGNAVKGAIVTLAESGISPFPLEAATGKDGRASLGPIARGSATVSVFARDFMPRGMIAIPEVEGTELVVALVHGGEIRGRVVDARGFGIDGASLRVLGSDMDGAPIEDEPTSMAFRGAQAERLLAGPSSLIPAGELGVMPGPLPAIPGGSWSGSPRSSAGLDGTSAAAQSRRSLSRDAKADAASTWVTERDGSFSLSPVTPGRIYVFARHPEFVEAASELVVLTPDGRASTVVTMLKGGSVEGRVTDVRGHAVEGAYVTLGEGKLGRERSTRSATDGSFAFAAVPSEVSLSVAPPEDSLRIVAKTSVHVDDGKPTKVDLVIPAARDDVEVGVVDDRGSPMATAQISASSTDPQEPTRVTAFTDRLGKARLRGVRGLDLRIEVRAPHFAPHIATLSGGAASLRVALAVAEGVSGDVRSYRGEPLAAAEVTLSTAEEVFHAVTSADGAFEIEGMASGPATLRVTAQGYAPSTKAVMIREERGRRKTALARIELSPEAAVEGEVVDGQGKPVPGARVAQDHAPSFTTAARVRDAMTMAVSDAKGHFHLGALPEGTVTLEAYAPEAGRGRVTLQNLTRGRPTTNVRIMLQQDAKDGPLTDLGAAGSIAVTLGQSGTEVVVVAVLSGGNAERAGVRQNDTLVAVDGVPVHTIEEARKRMTGPPRDDVVLRLRRGDQPEIPLRVSRELLRR